MTCLSMDKHGQFTVHVCVDGHGTRRVNCDMFVHGHMSQSVLCRSYLSIDAGHGE